MEHHIILQWLPVAIFGTARLEFLVFSVSGSSPAVCPGDAHIRTMLRPPLDDDVAGHQTRIKF